MEQNRTPETELHKAVTHNEAVEIILRDPKIQVKLDEIVGEYDCTRHEAAMRYFQRVCNTAESAIVEGMTEGDISKLGWEWGKHPMYQWYEEVYGRQPKTPEEEVEWWLAYDAAHTKPISGGVRHNIPEQEQFKQLVAIGTYPYATAARAHRIVQDNPTEAIAMLAKYDTHHRTTEIMPIADKLRKNIKHKIARIISDAEKDLECIYD